MFHGLKLGILNGQILHILFEDFLKKFKIFDFLYFRNLIINSYPLIPPVARPETINFCINKVKMRTGNVTTNAPAAKVPQYTCSKLIILYTATGRVRVYGPASITGKIKLFQEAK